MQSVMDAIDAGLIDGKIVLVISDKQDAYALERARKAGIQTAVIRKRDFSALEDFHRANLAAVHEANVDGVILAGYLSILGSELVEEYRGRIINIHPSLIPSFCGKGYYGVRVHRAVLEYGAKVSGATVHFVDEGADTGPIIMQRTVPVLEDDGPEDLAARVLKVEHQMLPECVALFCRDALVIEGRKVRILEK